MTSISKRLEAAVGTRRGLAAANELCAACVDLLSVDAAAISLVFDGVNTGTLGASGARAQMYDELQFILGEGPCLQSVKDRTSILVDDMERLGGHAFERWDAYRPALLAYGVHAVFAIPVLLAGQYVGALDLFREAPGMLTSEELAGALIAAELAELPIIDLLAHDLDATDEEPESGAAADLNTVSRAEVNQATGMLVGQLDVSPAEALIRLRAHAYATGRSATQVARDILDLTLTLEA